MTGAHSCIEIETMTETNTHFRKPAPTAVPRPPIPFYGARSARWGRQQQQAPEETKRFQVRRQR